MVKEKSITEENSRQARLLRLLLENSADIMFLLDKNFNIAYCTRAFLDRHHIPGFDAIHNRNFIEVIKQHMGKGIAQKANSLLVNNQEFLEQGKIEFDIQPEGKHNEYFHVHVNSLLMDNSFDGYMILFHNITAQVRAKEKAEKANAAKSNYLAAMGHEIRTPMNAIIGMSDLAMQEAATPQMREHLTNIKQAGRNLLALINDILDFSKIEVGGLQMVNAPYDLAFLINDVFSVIRIQLNNKHLLFLAEIDAHIPRLLFGDAARVRQILFNLLSNAVKYTNQGFVKISITGITKNDELYLLFEISDSGIGIKNEDIKKLFKAYVRLDEEKNTGIEGTGLGLSITHNLCKAMGGGIVVRSEYGKGSTFSVSIVQKISDHLPLVEVESPEQKKTLFYTDNPLFSASLAWTLENLGVEAVSAADEKELLEKLGSGYWDYVFFPESYITKIKYCINTSSVKTIPVLLANAAFDVPLWEGLVAAFPCYAVTVANAMEGKQSFLEHNNEISFICPDYKILIVDDLEINLKIAEGLFSPYQVKTTVCKDGQKAIELVKQEDFDLIVLDHLMPGMDGIDVVKAIRSLEGQKYKDVPVIAMTANASEGIQERFLTEGFNDYLLKPVETQLLAAFLEKWVDEKRRRPRELPKNDRLDIKGMDENKGLAHRFHSKEEYHELLRLYCADVDYRLEVLQNFDDRSRAKERQTAALHIIKSAAEVIGASVFADLAGELEMDFLNGNWNRDALSRFAGELDVFRKSILSALESEAS